MGTSVGAKVFTEHGWRADASLNLAWTGFTLFVLLMRGPHCPRYTWFGWKGGFELRKSRVVAAEQAERDAAAEKQGGAGETADGEDGEEDMRDEKAPASVPLEVGEGEKGGGTDGRGAVDMV